MDFERRVMGTVKAVEERGEPPLVWAMEAGRWVQECGMKIPCMELGEVLVTNLCFGNNTPALWKILDHAMASHLVFPIHTLALLTPRVIPHRRVQPQAYRLYLELLCRYSFPLSSMGHVSCYEKVINSIDDALQLSSTCGSPLTDIGQMVVLYFFSVIVNLTDSLLEDCGLHMESAEKKCSTFVDLMHDMDIDSKESANDKRNERFELLHKANVFMAIETLERITSNKSSKILLRLVHLNMPEKFNCLLKRLQFIEAQKQISQNLATISQNLAKVSTNILNAMNGEVQFNHHQLIGAMIGVNPRGLSKYYHSGASQTACWIAFDIFMEKALDGRQLHVSAIDVLSEMTLSLQVINEATWQETFKALWLSALRLVQREREPSEGPIPHLDVRLCILLSITPLAIGTIIEREDAMLSHVNDGSRSMRTINEKNMDGDVCASKRRGLVSSLQQLEQFTILLSPPLSVVRAANVAATKAATFISNFKKGNDSFDGMSPSDNSVKAIGNMLHLIVEACIARKLIDTSVYFWPGYVVTSSVASTYSMSVQESCWSAFMEGAQLTGSLMNSLIDTPASSTTQVEKLYHIALNGSEGERSAAAKILCGTCLTRGWNIQEHVVHFVVKLLAHPLPPDFTDTENNLVGYMLMLHSLLFGACRIDVVHIMSLHGMVPAVAAALMPLCEAFGSLSPLLISKLSTREEPSVYSIFSCAFLFLLRLWKFYSPPQEHNIAERWAHTEMTLDYLLLLHNSHAPTNGQVTGSGTLMTQPVYIDSFPKLHSWYFQNQACVASTLSGVCSVTPLRQVANKVLNMICKKISRFAKVSGNDLSTDGSMCSSPTNMGEDAQQRSYLPAWDILQAIPFVLEALLTACANEELSSRELTTGLRDLVEFLPASFATIITFFTAEITRGIWKPVQMNGTDWPSPAANLASIESEIKEILASAGVQIQSSCSRGTVPVMLPLPMAALVGLTITFKLDKSFEYIHGVAGPALENCATSCPWPSMPIIGALWEQKVRRWHDFIVFSCVRSPFRQDKDAICQLLRRCFISFLGPQLSSGSHMTTNHCVNGLLGHSFFEHGSRLPIAPGFLYIRCCKTFPDTRLVSHEILKLVTASAREITSGFICNENGQLKSGKVSLASAAARAKQIATLGSSLLLAAGGPRMAQVLYMETMPTWLLSRSETRVHSAPPTSCILEGYALAYMSIMSGAFTWGIGNATRPTIYRMLACRSRCARSVSTHMDFMARVMEGSVSLGCDPVTWKAYVSCFLGLLVRFMPTWVQHVKQETLRKLATGLRRWRECELALALLERGGPASMTLVVEFLS